MNNVYRMLIVDDEPHIIEGIKRLVDWKSYNIVQIESAVNYHEAIEKAVEIRPHIAIFDVCIEDKKGYEIIKELNKLNLPTKYIMISGYDEFCYARQAMLVGAREYLVKPVNKNELKRIVEEIIVKDLGGIIENGGKKEKDFDPVLMTPYEDISNLCNKIILITHGEYHRAINLKVIAEKFKMNSTYLGKIFLNETHLKYSEYLMCFRMIKAREKIISANDKIAYIAHSVGYTNLNHFYTHFNLFFGCSPTEIRKELS